MVVAVARIVCLCCVCPQVPLKNTLAERSTAYEAQMFAAKVESITYRRDGGIRDVIIQSTPAVEGVIEIDNEIMEFKPCATTEVRKDLVRWAREGYLVV